MNFKELLEEHGVPLAPEGHHHQTEGWVQFDCPFCGQDTHSYHMGYNVHSHFVNCWKCGGHNLVITVANILRITALKARKLIEQIDHYSDRAAAWDETPANKHCVAPMGLEILMKAHIKYLNSRGFRDIESLYALWRIKGIGPKATRLKWRIWIPIIYKDTIVSWTTRAVGEQQKRRYISAGKDEEAIPHKHLLYGHDFARNSAIIVEGPLDVWTIGPGAVSTFGTALTDQQIYKIAHIPRRIICFDNEPEAQKQARKLQDHLGVLPGETINVVLDAKDPNSAKPKEIRRLRKFLE